MITLALLKQMASDEVADLEIDKSLFWEEMPLQKAKDRGGSSSHLAVDYC